MKRSDVARQALDAIGRFYAIHKTTPQVENVAVKYNVTVPEAQAWIEEFLTTNGESPAEPEAPQPVAYVPIRQESQRVAPEPKAVPEAKKGGLFSRIGKALDALTDKGSLWFAVFIDLILNGIGFWVIGPDPIMKAGMVCVSVIVVLFSVRAWIKGNKILWLNFALVASFMDISFILLATDVQSQNAGQDTELTRLTDQAKKDQGYLEDLQAKQLEKGQGFKDQITLATEARDKSNAALERYRSLGGTTAIGHYQMTASKVFTAIPDALLSGRWDRWIATIILTMVFVGLQFTIISATGVKWNAKADD